MNARSISQLIKNFVSEEDDTIQPSPDIVMDALNHVEVMLTDADSSVLSDGNIETKDLFTSLIDLLLYDDQNRTVSKTSLSLLSKMMKQPLLYDELKNTYKLHLALCSFYNNCFLLADEDESVINEVLSMILHITLNAVDDDPHLLRITVLNLIRNVKNSKQVRLSLGCLRNFLTQTNFVSTFCSLERANLWSFFKILSQLAGSDHKITALYSRTIVLVLISKHAEFMSVFPSTSKMEFLEESMCLIKTSINSHDPEIIEASLTLGSLILEDSPKSTKLSSYMYSIVEAILFDLNALHEINSNTNAAIEFLICYQRCCPENILIGENSVICERLINWSQNKIWMCGDLPALSLKLINRMFMNSLRVKEVNRVLNITKKVPILSTLALLLKIKINYHAFKLKDIANLKLKYEALCLLSTLLVHSDIRSSIPETMFPSLQLTLDPRQLDVIFSNRRALEGSIGVFLEGVYLLDMIKEVLPSMLLSQLSSIHENSHWPSFISRGLTSGLPSLVETSLNILKSSSIKQLSNNTWGPGETSFSLGKELPIFDSLVKELSTAAVSTKKITNHFLQEVPLCMDTSSRTEIAPRKIKDVMDKGDHMLQEQLRVKNLEVKELKQIISSNIATLNQFQKRFALSECSTERNNQMVLDCFGEHKAACAKIENLKGRLQNKENLLKDKGEEVFKLKKFGAELEKENHRKDDEIEKEQTKIGQLEAELVNYKHDLAKLVELDQMKQKKISTSEQRANDLEVQNSVLLKDQENNLKEIKDLKSKIAILNNEVKAKDELHKTTMKELDETKHTVDVISKFLNGKK